MSLSKTDIISRMYANNPDDTRQAHAKKYKEVITAISDLLAEGFNLSLTNLGSFRVKDYSARMTKSPTTGAPVSIKASKRIAFRAAAKMKERLNSK